MLKNNFIVSIVTIVFLLFGVNSALGQCGADGQQPCSTKTPKKTTLKKTTKPTATKTKTTTKTPTKTISKTPSKQTCFPSTNFNNNDAPKNFTQTINGVKFEMVGIPSGSFCMGSNDSQYEKPIHRANINYSFYMGKYEVTQEQWQAVMGNNPSYFSNCGGDCPVENVSWDDVQGFIRNLNNLQSEYKYRLPSEAEWEYACRAGTTGDYGGNLDSMAWYNANSNNKTHEVGAKRANAWGLYEMHGNVWEWVEDIFDNYNFRSMPTDGSPNLSVRNSSHRVLRGGGWNGETYDLTSANRSSAPSTSRWNGWGFRLVSQ